MKAKLFQLFDTNGNKMVKNEDKNWWAPAVKLFAELAGWVVIPILLGVYFGNWLDSRFDTAPWLFVASVAVAFVITNVGIVRRASGAMKEISRQENEDKNKSKK
ncbi:TPA: hypothetical protein DF272_06500 [Candidatus Falkowbacteria bacterium]|nr:hypothetical protein [Candidatus Falkowbacteria bacterium]